MKNLFEAGRVLLLDLASTIFFLMLYLLTHSLFLSVAVGMALGLGQIGWQLFHGKPIAALQWISVIAVLASGTATLLTHDATFVMLKPSLIYTVVGVVMLKRGWMNRYLPPRAAAVLDVATTFGYAWAGMMFFSAALNIALALSFDVTTWAAAMSTWGIASKIGLFLIQYTAMTMVGKRRARAATAATT